MPARTITLEVHELDSRTGQHCPACGDWTAVTADLGIVASDSLELLGHVTGLHCTSCGFSDHWR